MDGSTLGKRLPSGALAKPSCSFGTAVEELVGVRKALPRFRAVEKAVVMLKLLRLTMTVDEDMKVEGPGMKCMSRHRTLQAASVLLIFVLHSRGLSGRSCIDVRVS